MELRDWLTLVGVLFGGGLGTKMLLVGIETRDSIRDHIRDVGTKEPPTGLFREVLELKHDTESLYSHLSGLGPQFRLERRHAERRDHQS